jgi:uncharacterized protein
MKSDSNKDGFECFGGSSSGGGANSSSLVDPPGAVQALQEVETTAEEQQHANCSTDKDKQDCVSGTSNSVSIGLAGENEEAQSPGNGSPSSAATGVVLDHSLLQSAHEKRRNHGRSARRRRRKFLDIQQREEEIRQDYMQQKKQHHQQQQQQQQQQPAAIVGNLEENSLSNKKESCSSIPMDRDKVWPAVAERRRQFAEAAATEAEHVDDLDDCGWRGPADERLLIGQLGFLPGNAIRVSARVKDLRQGPGEAVQQQQQQQDADFSLSMERLLLASSAGKNRNSSNNSDDYDIVLDHDDGQVPVVLQLYPLVYRDEYTGGREDGRKVAKGRKRRLARKGTNDNDNADDISTPVVRGDNGNHNGNADAPAKSQKLVAVDSLSNDIDAETVVVEPFPTIYWLTHPLLRVWISQLELDGLGVRLQQRLADPGSEALLERMKRAHEAYAMERVQLLTPADVALVQARHWEDALLTTGRGVAGVRNPKAVKCLHAHAAHYLSDVCSNGSSDNVVGEWVMQEVHKMLNERSRRENGEN